MRFVSSGQQVLHIYGVDYEVETYSGVHTWNFVYQTFAYECDYLLSTTLGLNSLFFDLSHHEETGIEEPLYAVGETAFLTPGKARRWRASYAFVPACSSELLN